MNPSRKKKLTVVLIALVALYTIIGFVILPMIAMRIVPENISARINRPVSMEAVRFNPFTCSVGIRGFAIGETDGGEFLHIADVHVNVQMLESLLTFKPVVKTVAINEPRVRIALDETGAFNFANMAPEAPADPSAAPDTVEDAEDAAGPSPFLVHEFTLSRGRFVFSDRSGGKSFDTLLHPIDIQVTNLTAGENQRTYYQAEMNTESDEALHIKGWIGLADLGGKGLVRLAGIVPAKYAPYYDEQVLFHVTDGRMDMEMEFETQPGGELPDGLTCTIQTAIDQFELTLHGEEQPFVVLPDLNARNIRIDMDRHRIHGEQVNVNGFHVRVGRDGEGRVNLTNLFPADATEDATGDAEETETRPAADKDADWTFDLDELRIDAAAIRWEDSGIASPATLRIDGIDILVKDISTHRDVPADLRMAMRIGDTGRFEMNGDIDIRSPGADIALVLKDLRLEPFQPYVTEYTNIMLTGGAYGLEGNVRLIDEGAEGMNATFEGRMALTDFGLVEADGETELIAIKSLRLSDMRAVASPREIGIGEISLTNPAIRIVMNPDGSLNLAGIVKQTEEEQPSTPPDKPAVTDTPAPETTPVNIRIDVVTLKHGELSFTDRHIQPRFEGRLHDLEGRISGLSSLAPARAELDITGVLNGQAPLKIAGRINPLIAKPFIDLDVSLEHVGLNRFSPYSGKYIGYSLERGNLFLNLEYELNDNALKGDNRVVFDRLTLGERVESEDALRLPMPLILAILTDRHGKIEIDLPVTGQLDDPEFRFGKLLGKVFINFLARVATSPFAALNSLLGGVDVRYVAYAPGEARIDGDELEKISRLALALYERPALRLDIRGTADPDTDAAALKRKRFQERLNMARRNDLPQTGRSDHPLDRIEMTAEERKSYIRRLFEEAEFPKPLDGSGSPKQLPVEEMEDLLIAHIPISEDDLRQLARARADNAREELIQRQPVEPGRLFLVSPDISAAGTREEGAAQPAGRSRVEFTLK